MSIHEIEVDGRELEKAFRAMRPGEALFLTQIPAGAKFISAEERTYDRKLVIVYELPDDRPAAIGILPELPTCTKSQTGDIGTSVACGHTITQGRAGEKGSWCVSCGEKVYEVDDRECKDCDSSRKVLSGWICRRHLMAIAPGMNVTFKISEGSCWTPSNVPASAGPA